MLRTLVCNRSAKQRKENPTLRYFSRPAWLALLIKNHHAQLFHGKLARLAETNDLLLRLLELGRYRRNPGGNLFRNGDQAVLVSMQQIARLDLEAADIESSAEFKNVRVGMRDNRMAGKKLQPQGTKTGQFAHRSVGYESNATQGAQNRSVHIAKKSANAAQLIHILQYHDAR